MLDHQHQICKIKGVVDPESYSIAVLDPYYSTYANNKPSVFISALDILESLESHAKTFSSFNWESLFNSTIPWLATLILITRTSTPPTQDEQNRAQHQIDRIFSLHESLPISQTPMWKMLVQLRSRIQGDLSSGEEAEVLADSRTGYVDDFMLDMGDDLFDEQLMADGMVDMPW